MQSFGWGGASLAYRVEGEGPRIVFLHNGGASSTIWRHQARSLRSRHQVVLIDFPGFGAAPRPRPAVERGALVELVAGLLDHLDHLTGEERPSPALVVGNCMGANVAAGLALGHPELVAGLVLVNPLTEVTFGRGWLGPLHVLWQRVPALRSVVRAGARFRLPRAAAAGALRFQLGRRGVNGRIHHDAELLAAYQRRDQLPALLDVLGDLPAYGWLDRFAAVSPVPIWTVWGAENRVLSPEAGAALGVRLRAGERVVLEGCGHLPMLEDPASFTAIVERAALGVLGTGAGAVSTSVTDERTFL